MSLTKQAVADLAKEIRRSRVIAAVHADEPKYMNSCFLGALESTIAHFVQQQQRDSTEVRAAFNYVPTAEDLQEYRAQQAKWQADYQARKAAAAGSAS